MVTLLSSSVTSVWAAFDSLSFTCQDKKTQLYVFVTVNCMCFCVQALRVRQWPPPLQLHRWVTSSEVQGGDRVVLEQRTSRELRREEKWLDRGLIKYKVKGLFNWNNKSGSGFTLKVRPDTYNTWRWTADAGAPLRHTYWHFETVSISQCWSASVHLKLALCLTVIVSYWKPVEVWAETNAAKYDKKKFEKYLWLPSTMKR